MANSISNFIRPSAFLSRSFILSFFCSFCFYLYFFVSVSSTIRINFHYSFGTCFSYIAAGNDEATKDWYFAWSPCNDFDLFTDDILSPWLGDKSCENTGVSHIHLYSYQLAIFKAAALFVRISLAQYICELGK